MRSWLSRRKHGLLRRRMQEAHSIFWSIRTHLHHIDRLSGSIRVPHGVTRLCEGSFRVVAKPASKFARVGRRSITVRAVCSMDSQLKAKEEANYNMHTNGEYVASAEQLLQALATSG